MPGNVGATRLLTRVFREPIGNFADYSTHQFHALIEEIDGRFQLFVGTIVDQPLLTG